MQPQTHHTALSHTPSLHALLTACHPDDHHPDGHHPQVGSVSFDRQGIADHATNLAKTVQGNLKRSLEALGVVRRCLGLHADTACM